ncbi:MAG: hypothetical protein JO142_21350 [Burkholderiales bacterium]|nr:hypothetical protein [Burkholderiales bacterium]
MSAFCVFGVSRQICKTAAEKQVSILSTGAAGRNYKTPEEWGKEVEGAASKIFEEATKIGRISPEFDTPQFCEDWIAVSPDQVRLTQIMVRVPARDKEGGVKMRKGVPVMAWTPYLGSEEGITHPLLDAIAVAEVAND